MLAPTPPLTSSYTGTNAFHVLPFAQTKYIADPAMHSVPAV